MKQKLVVCGLQKVHCLKIYSTILSLTSSKFKTANEVLRIIAVIEMLHY